MVIPTKGLAVYLQFCDKIEDKRRKNKKIIYYNHETKRNVNREVAMPYPDNYRGSRTVEIDLRCKDCGYRWDVEADDDLGLVTYDDVECPDCGSENIE